MAKWITLSSELLSAFSKNQITFNPRVKSGHRFFDTGKKFEPGCQLPNTRLMPLGRYSYSLCGFSACETIGRYCSIGRGIQVFGDHHPIDWLSTSPVFYRPHKFVKSTGENPHREMPPFNGTPTPITIGNDVWVGDNVTFKDGINIGDGAIIAAGSIVTKNVAPYSIVGGNPAKPIRQRFPKEISDELLKLRWWQYDINAVQVLATESIEQFLCQAHELGETEIVPERRTTVDGLLG